MRLLFSLGCALITLSGCIHPFGDDPAPDREEQARDQLRQCAEIEDAWSRQQCTQTARESLRAASDQTTAMDAAGRPDPLHDRDIIEGKDDRR